MLVSIAVAIIERYCWQKRGAKSTAKIYARKKSEAIDWTQPPADTLSMTALALAMTFPAVMP
jgi:hypothetical protein